MCLIYVHMFHITTRRLMEGRIIVEILGFIVMTKRFLLWGGRTIKQQGW